MRCTHRGTTRDNERGASAAEYALLIGLIAVIIITGISALGLSLQDLYGNSCTDVASATKTTC